MHYQYIFTTLVNKILRTSYAFDIDKNDWELIIEDIVLYHIHAGEYSRKDAPGVLTFKGNTLEGLDLVVHYDIAHKRIKSHYPDSEKFWWKNI